MTAVPLHTLPKGAHAKIISIDIQEAFGAHDEKVTLRLKELGFLPGATLKIIGYGLFGKDPIAVQINGTKFGLRRREAEKILAVPHKA
ncbi:ferrous iron transport protein A [Leeia sp. TBRC 13508]|uniref:Ferrous iron transport protein A n=1 Tax=Leeia speluncae TaxID=2884804 RepID=A0ABS8D879_9NEIS|nr:FeoA family protein [Leeia speluncae]MCB6183843.1 ferrous iron transport protein A [Leeia speluncae]